MPSFDSPLMRVGARLALAKPLARLLSARRRRGVDAGLDPQVAAILEAERLLGLPALDTMQPADARAYAAEGLAALEVAPAAMDRIVDVCVPGPATPIPVRIYEPHAPSGHWLVYFHGGGGVIGSIRGSDPIVRLLAAQTGCTVASVEYRLGPEHRHPAAIDDAVAAYTAILPRVAAGKRVAVGGDSFGGYLAAQVEHAVVRRPDLQVLIYPLVDQTLTSPSLARNAEGYLLTTAMVQWFQSHYLNADDDRRAASPKYWASHRGAAPAIVVTAGYDPLVDEGDEYAAQLRAAGVTVRHRPHPSLIHGFLSLAGAVDAARAAVDQLSDDIREMLAGS